MASLLTGAIPAAPKGTSAFALVKLFTNSTGGAIFDLEHSQIQDRGTDMETVTDTKQQNFEVLASDILVAILINLKRFCCKKQLFLKANYNTFQEVFSGLCSISNTEFIKKYFVFSNRGPVSFSRDLQEAIEQLQFAGMINWPDIQEPDLMKLNPSAEDRYEKVLTADERKRRLLAQDIVTIQQIARRIMMAWSELIVDRPHLMNC